MVIQIQHLLKLNEINKNESWNVFWIQIQHLLKLNQRLMGAGAGLS